MSAPVISVERVHKAYDGIPALRGVNVELRPGEIHAIMGENGSGKSTLLSLIAGVQAPTQGSIVVNGTAYQSLNPRLARSLGIALVQQEPQLAAALTVGENVMMGRLATSGGFVSWAKVHDEAQRVLDTLGIPLSARATVSTLSTGRRQLVEIAKGLVDEPRVLLLDEATSSLDEADSATLFEVLRDLREKGVAIAFVSHRFKEVMSLADHATVLRDGSLVGTLPMADADQGQLVSMMVGRNLENYWHKADVQPGETVLDVRNVYRGALEDISINVRRGEIVGLAGLVGSGRSALMRTLMGVKPASGGTIEIDGRKVHVRSPRKAHELGMGYVPEDRKAEGLVMGWSIMRNAALSLMNDRGPLALLGAAFDRAALQHGSRGLKIKSTSPSQSVRELSGGNQQKVVLTRELATNPKILLLDEPTRGVDVGAKEDIYAQLATLAKQGVGVLVASSELPELLGICDRIYVMFRCRVVAELSAAEATESAITYWSSGAHELAATGHIQ